MNLVISFLDGYVDSGARVADLDRITWDTDYLKGYRQRIADEREWAAKTWMTDDNIFNADHRNLYVTDDPTISELMAMHEADSYADEPGYRTSWQTY